MELWLAFVDLEKAFSSVQCVILCWVLRHVKLEVWIVDVIKSMYEGAATAVKLKNSIS